ncbi:OB-fold nucleic acid binding domain-containing protein [Methanolobus mangrovi]|uniref:OB-fold nucleic acid binding domain-containing protein n=1 Tax=Methanolobus mangrovi TaxID=3072977 RepID=A0AA51UFZ1_9EURY|nr:OB-fold nucleic acid binding domain-containing protein [Methanolobus mangrovi]WMW22544.1 OB-fold nucleic acid binding domain-containing protein [Methanolobus mangrovi]
MEKEEKIVVILLCMALLSLTIAYASFYSGDDGSSIGEFSSSSLPGEDVRLEGDVLSKSFTYTGGHLLMDIDYGSGVVKVFVPSNNGANDIDSQINENDHVLITGIVDEYGGDLEVVVQSSGDVDLLK